jgi:putative thioredoxin
LQQLLEIVRHDRNFGDDNGRKQMLAVFDILGGKGALVTRYRNLLSAALN